MDKMATPYIVHAVKLEAINRYKTQESPSQSVKLDGMKSVHLPTNKPDATLCTKIMSLSIHTLPIYSPKGFFKVVSTHH